MIENISGVILAGGENKRFSGKSKPGLSVGGRKIIIRMLDIVRELFDEVIIISNSPGDLNDITGCIIVPDIFQKAGPLGGIHAAMKISEKKSVFVFAGDMPFLDKELIISMLHKYNESQTVALVPVVNNLPEPLHSIYSNSLFNELDRYLKENKTSSVKFFLKRIEVKYIELQATEKTKRAFTNINTPTDLLSAEEQQNVDL